jgi:hypothetical protein
LLPGTIKESFIASHNSDILFCSELAVPGLVSSTPESVKPPSYIPKKSSTLIPSSLPPNTEVAELLFVNTLLRSVPLVPRKLELVVRADRKLALTSSLSKPFGRVIGSRRCVE